MMGTNGAVLFSLLIYAALLYGAVLITTDEVRLYDFSIRSLFEQTSPSYFYQIFFRTEFVYFLDR